MTKIALIYGSSRPSNVGEKIAEYFKEHAQASGEVELEMVNLADENLPLIDEVMPPMMSQYEHEHTKAWSKKIEGYDGFVFFTAVYNHGYTPILKNAIDMLFNEWMNKPTAIVSYGAGPVSNSAKQLREVLEHMKVQLVDETMHVFPVHEAVTDSGVDLEAVQGDPAEVVQALIG